jgi:hypothetical protein
VNTFLNTVGDIYGEVPPGGIVGQGWDVGGPGPILHVPDVAYGLLLAMDNNDGHSNGEADPNAPLVIYFSGDDASMGVPWTEYRWQANLLQAAGDRFVTNGFTSVSPVTVMTSGGGPAVIVGPVIPGRPINMVSANQDRYNEIPSIPVWAMNMYVPNPCETAMDDMDAVELTPMDLNGDNIHETPIYFTLDAASPSLMFAGVSRADVLVSPPGVAAFLLFAPAPMLGLSVEDEVDALAVWDFPGLGVPNPGLDYALFSLAPGSPFLDGPDLIPGTADDYSAAHIFVTDFTGVNALYLRASAIGMRFTDNVDAIDVEIFTGPGSVEVWEEFVPQMVILEVELKNPGKSTVEIEPDGDPNGPLVREFFLNELVTLTAVPEGNKSFKQWKLWDPNDPTDANLVVFDANNPITIDMSTDRKVTAVFKCGSSAGPFLPMMLCVLGLFVWVKRKG